MATLELIVVAVLILFNGYLAMCKVGGGGCACYFATAVVREQRIVGFFA